MEAVARSMGKSNTRGKWPIVTQLTILSLLGAACIYFLWPRPAPAPQTPAPAAAVPAHINLILDTSASMQGYLNGHTELKDKVAELIAQIDELGVAPSPLKSVTYQFGTDSGEIINSGYDSRGFIQRLLNDTLMAGQASLLQDLFRNAVAETNKDTVSLLVTDSIFSYSDQAVKANPEINKNNIAGLAADITLTFNKAKEAGISVSLLAARSSFHGKYYNYRNVAQKCCNIPRPYYVWVLGEASRIRGLLDFLQKHGAIYEHELDFNLQPTELSLAICQHTKRVGTWYTDHRNRHRIEDVDTDPAKNELQFALALDLSSLPKELSTISFLNQHLLVQSSEMSLKGKMINLKAEVEKSFDRRDARNLAPYTHLVVLKTDNSFAKTAAITLFIEDALPDWYLQWSNDDDTADDPQTSATTFGLKEIVTGVAQAYRRAEPVAKVTLHLSR